ncbi:MAG: glycoside hydrolase family 99-like domain-containing protein [Sulfuricellaceae bacterium]|nr:glycoside hydrolase family 99-like domain-containing protein [Sulfuricellaceae bacterium]
MNTGIRAIAFFLPQFHPVPENDEWWGQGFTEWTNVSKARPLFPGHYQPHLPADLGFYDLRLPEAREAQAALARAYGIHGFCYYHYWFAGRNILERPFNEVLATGKPDFPFCLCWANENWTRTWDGGDSEILLGQNYGDADDRAHILSLIPALRDPRYIRIDGRPLLLIYRTESLPNPRRTAMIWREEALNAGIGDIYLARVESFSVETDPRDIGFDAAVEFAPDWRQMGDRLYRSKLYEKAVQWRLLPDIYMKQSVASYDTLKERMLAKPAKDHVRFRCVTPGFDNTARRETTGATLFLGTTPAKYEDWLEHSVEKTIQECKGDERIVFLNAWNEWGEGNHLEPDMKYGHAFLEATARGLGTSTVKVEQSNSASTQPSDSMHSDRSLRATYWRLRAALIRSEIWQLVRHIRYWRCRGF